MCAQLYEPGIGECVFWIHNCENCEKREWWLSLVRVTKHKYFETRHDLQTHSFTISHSFDLHSTATTKNPVFLLLLKHLRKIVLNWFWAHHFTETSSKMNRKTLDAIRKFKSINEHKKRKRFHFTWYSVWRPIIFDWNLIAYKIKWTQLIHGKTHFHSSLLNSFKFLLRFQFSDSFMTLIIWVAPQKQHIYMFHFWYV